MKKRKYRLEMYEFYDHTGMVAHLEKMARRGWLLKQALPLIWVYRRMEPAEIHFAVSYTASHPQDDPDPVEGQAEFREYAAHTGWQYICSYQQMQFFYNEQEDPTPLETDPQLEVAVIHQYALRRHLRPLCGVIALQSFAFLSSFSWISFLLHPIEMLSAALFFLMLFGVGSRIIRYVRWYRQAQAAAEWGEFLPVKGRTLYLFNAFLTLSLLLCIFVLLYRDNQDDPQILLGYACVIGVVLLLFGVSGFCQARQYPAKKEWGIVGIAVFVACLILLSLPPFQSGGTDSSAQPEPAGPPAASLLLNLEDLGLENPDIFYRTTEERRASPFLEQITQSQYASSAVPELSYTVTRVRLPLFYSLCQGSLLDQYEDVVPDFYSPTSPDPWMALDAYRRSPAGGDTCWYLLCYENCFVELVINWSPTPEQMARIAGQLAGTNSL